MEKRFKESKEIMDAYLTYAVGERVIWYMWTMCQMVKHV